MFGAAALIASAVCFAPNLATWAAAPFVRLIDEIYLGGGEKVVPPVEYKLARMYAGQGRAQEALDEYLRIVIHHPREADAYREAIPVAIKAGDRRLARWLYRRARWRVPDRALRAELRSLLISATAQR